MTRPRRPGSARGGKLSDEDEALWARVAETLEPLKTRGRRRSSPRPADQDPAEAAPPRRNTKADRDVAANARLPAPAAPSQDAKPPKLAEFDRRQMRKLGGGQREIEARLDLHGLRQSEAHAALRVFLQRCFAKRLRLVLVITGKGRAGDDGDRGVLRRNVPRWLDEPEVRAIVVGFGAAHVRHGGDGALYIQLRNVGRGRREP
jgi:DNA-nicking Smr family endonuclease